MKPLYRAIALLLLASAGRANAQSINDIINQNFGLDYNRGRNTSVTERARPDYSPTGLPLGAFTLYPALNTELSYVDNVFASPNNSGPNFGNGLGKVGDGIFTITPSIGLVSNWSRNAVSLTANVSRDEYFKYTENDTTNYGARANGRLDILDSDSIGGSLDYEYLTESRTSSAVAENSFSPSRYTHEGASGYGVYQLNRLRFRVTADANKYDYNNLVGTFGEEILNDERNNNVYDVGGRADYAVNQDAAVFASIGYNDRQFEFVPTLQDSHGYELLVGFNLDVTNLVRGEVGVGYLIQDYRDGATQNGFAAQTQFQYFPSQLLTLTLNAERSLQNSTIINSSGDVASTVRLRADYELRRDVLLFAQGGFENDQYNGINFNDDRYTASFGATYLVNRLIALNAAFTHETQTTSGGVGPGFTPGSDTILAYPFDVNSVYIGLTLHR